MANIIIRNYEGYNSAMGKHITSKRHYEQEMRKGGYVSFEEGQKIAAKANRESHKDYKISDKARAVIASAKNSTDKNGNLKPSDRLIDGMKEVGVNFDRVPSQKEIDNGMQI